MCSDLYGAVEALGGRRFEVVYTGLGAIGWLPDIRRWAEVVATLVEPGGVLYLSEFHPFSWVFADENLSIEHGYFHHRLEFEDSGSYADEQAVTVNNRVEEWHHTLGDAPTGFPRGCPGCR